MMVSRILMCMAGVLSLMMMGCELPSVDNQQQEDASTNNAPVAPTAPANSTNQDQVGFGGPFIPGDTADAGSEIYRSLWNSCDVRCIAANYDDNGYFMSDIIDQADALELSGETATGHNFISPRTGLHYKFIGFKEETVNSDLITENPHRVVNHGTFRCYWNPVQGL